MLTFPKQCATEFKSSLLKHINFIVIENLSLQGNIFLYSFSTWQNYRDFSYGLVRH